MLAPDLDSAMARLKEMVEAAREIGISFGD